MGIKGFRFNKDKADKIYKDFSELTGYEVSNTSKTDELAITRALLYKIFMKYNNMKDKNISEWYAAHGIKKNRSSIYTAVRKVDMYYNQFFFIRDYYDCYFDDKLELRSKLEKTTKTVVKLKKVKTDKLQSIVNTLEGSKRQEILELIELRIKSWSWKNTDKCTVIEGSGALEGVY